MELACRPRIPEKVAHLQSLVLVTKTFWSGFWLAFCLSYSRGNYLQFLATWKHFLAQPLLRASPHQLYRVSKLLPLDLNGFTKVFEDNFDILSVQAPDDKGNAKWLGHGPYGPATNVPSPPRRASDRLPSLIPRFKRLCQDKMPTLSYVYRSTRLPISSAVRNVRHARLLLVRSDDGLLPHGIVAQAQELMREKSYHCVIGVEKEGLALGRENR